MSIPALQQTLQAAMQHHQAGHLAQAEVLYRQVLAQHPDHSDALNLLGLIAHQVGKHEAAIELIGRAIRINPAVASYHCNLGIVYQALNQFDQAIACYQQALILKPDSAEAHYNLGLAYSTQGKLDEAIACYREALAINPNLALAQNNLGHALSQQDRLDEAVICYQKALVITPDLVETQYNLCNILDKQSKLDEAISCYQKVLTLKPNYIDALCNLCIAFSQQGKRDEAVTCFRRALIFKPDEIDLHGQLAELLMQQQQPSAAVPHVLFAFAHDGADHAENWDRLSRLLALTALRLDEHTRPVLVRALSHPAIRPGEIAASVAASLCHDPWLAELIAHAEADRLPRGQALIEPLVHLASDALLRVLMESAIFPCPPLERLFTALRRSMLLEMASEAVPPAAWPFCVALAIQCFITDFAYFVTEAESVAVERLVDRLEGGARDEGVVFPPVSLALIAAYRPLHGLRCADALARMPWPASFASLIRVQLSEPLEEQALRAGIPSLTPIVHPVSERVRAQYEENPYPRWIRAGQVSRPAPLTAFLATLGGSVPSDPSFDAPEVLIAGCGSGQQSVYAASVYKDATILAIDLSMASLAYACRKTRELGLGNIEYRHGDILELGGIGRRFHVIECSGVLHHLADPLAGWRVLVDLLRPGGLMSIALYSALARRAIVAAREYIAAQGYGPSAADIRRCRRDILGLPADHPLARLWSLGDLFNTSECRDLLFHVQEHRFTLPQIQAALDQLGLRFLGFKNFPAAHAFRARFPDKSALTSLDAWHTFEQDNPDSFIHMYDFWVQKK